MKDKKKTEEFWFYLCWKLKSFELFKGFAFKTRYLLFHTAFCWELPHGCLIKENDKLSLGGNASWICVLVIFTRTRAGTHSGEQQESCRRVGDWNCLHWRERMLWNCSLHICVYLQLSREQRISQKVFRENGVWDFVACVIATGHITANQEFLPLDQKWKKTPKHCRLSYFKQSLKV